MRKVFQLSVVTVMLMFGLSLWLSATYATNRANAGGTYLSPTEINAKAIYGRSCAKCHGQDGKANRARGKAMKAQNLADKSWQESTNDEDMADAIKNGRGRMPAFKRLTDEEIKALVAYIRKFKT